MRRHRPFPESIGLDGGGILPHLHPARRDVREVRGAASDRGTGVVPHRLPVGRRAAASPRPSWLSFLQSGRLIHQCAFHHLLDDNVRMLPLHELAVEEVFPGEEDPAGPSTVTGSNRPWERDSSLPLPLDEAPRLVQPRIFPSRVCPETGSWTSNRSGRTSPLEDPLTERLWLRIRGVAPTQPPRHNRGPRARSLPAGVTDTGEDIVMIVPNFLAKAHEPEFGQARN